MTPPIILRKGNDMAIIERDIVLMSKDENGNTTIDKPITRLANIEADADVKEALADGDFIPIIDSEDGEQMKMISVNKIAKNDSLVEGSDSNTYIEEFSPSGSWNIDDLNLVNQAVDGVIPKHKTYVCLSSGYDRTAHGTMPEEESWSFKLDVDLIYSHNGYYVVKQDWFQEDTYHYRRYYNTNDGDGWTDWVSQFTAYKYIPSIESSATQIGMHQMSAGTAAATIKNCPSGSWYGQY